MDVVFGEGRRLPGVVVVGEIAKITVSKLHSEGINIAGLGKGDTLAWGGRITERGHPRCKCR